MKKVILCASLIMMIITSCSTPKQTLTYFEDISALNDTVISGTSYQLKIVPSDELFISINSIVPTATAAYNLPLANPATQSNFLTTTQPQTQTYIVNSDGYIVMPVLGAVKVEGMTTQQLTDYITQRVSESVADPMVRVEWLNFKVSVLVEVKAPGVQSISIERASILAAIARAGDVTDFGRRDNVILIREKNGKKVITRINLNDTIFL